MKWKRKELDNYLFGSGYFLFSFLIKLYNKAFIIVYYLLQKEKNS